MAVKTKKKKSFVVVFEPNEQGGYDVSFPQLPGCVTFGRSFEEAQKMAREVLELYLEESSDTLKSTESQPIISQIVVTLPKS